MKLSIVSTIYRTSSLLDRFHAECVEAAKKAGFDDYEMILTVDGSPDDWRGATERLLALDSRVKIIELSRNFGHHAAIWCGLEHAKGELVFLIDSDLEVAPSILNEFSARLSQYPDVDVAYAFQEKRGGNLQTLAFGRLFWIVFRHLSSVEIPADLLTERLMRRSYVDALLRLGDRNLFLGGMMAWAGFRQVGVPTLKQTREGQASYSFARRLSLLVDAVTSFSDLPMRYLFSFGSLISVASFMVAFFLMIKKLLNPEYVLQGFTFLAVLLLFTLGAMIGSIGLIGIYIGKIFIQTRARPIYIIKRIH